MIDLIALTVLAQQRETGPDFGKASPLGLLIVVLLLVATGLLVWSMNRHLRKLPKSFDDDATRPDGDAREGATGVDPDPPTSRPDG